ncbi:MAG: hypothetical protein ABI777_04110 [Betaproteobacteria bacterium]
MTHSRASLSSSVSMRNPQRGVVLFVALVAMVVLSLAAVALIRSVDTGASIAGNLATKQGTLGPINYAIERATDALFQGGPGSIADPFNHDVNHNYFANLQAGARPNGIPAMLYGPTPASLTYPVTFEKYDDTSSPPLYSVRWVIERVCQGSAPAPGPFTGDPLTTTGLQACDLLVPKVSTAGTAMEEAPSVPPAPLYRVTIRVDGPANTVTYAQAMLR